MEREREEERRRRGICFGPAEGRESPCVLQASSYTVVTVRRGEERRAGLRTEKQQSKEVNWVK